jgi:hypothetical protein
MILLLTLCPADRRDLPAAIVADGIIVQRLVKSQAHIGGQNTLLTQAMRIATSPPSATGRALALTRDGDAHVAAAAASDEP